MFKHLPNILTIIRFLLIPLLIVFAIYNNYVAVIIVLTISGITDILDGYIARKYDLISDFGKLMDPLADKATQVALLATLCLKNIVPLWILIIVLLKEFLMIAGASFLYGKELVVSSKWFGKLTTVLFYVAIVSSMVILYWNNYSVKHPEYNMAILPGFDQYIYYLSIVFSIFSLAMYIKSFYMNEYLKKMMKNKE